MARRSWEGGWLSGTGWPRDGNCCQDTLALPASSLGTPQGGCRTKLSQAFTVPPSEGTCRTRARVLPFKDDPPGCILWWGLPTEERGAWLPDGERHPRTAALACSPPPQGHAACLPDGLLPVSSPWLHQPPAFCFQPRWRDACRQALCGLLAPRENTTCSGRLEKQGGTCRCLPSLLRPPAWRGWGCSLPTLQGPGKAWKITDCLGGDFENACPGGKEQSLLTLATPLLPGSGDTDLRLLQNETQGLAVTLSHA